MYVYLPNGEQPASRVLLKDVLFAPSMGVTLISISQITGAGSIIVFTGNICQIYNKEKQAIGEIKVKGGLYRVFTSSSKTEAYIASTNEKFSINELHHHLGHVSHERARLLIRKGLVKGVELEANSEVVVCESCEWAKGLKKEIMKVREGERCAVVGKQVHSDLWGPAPVESINQKKYYVSFTDDYSRYMNVYFLTTKDEAFESYLIYEAWLSTQNNARIKCLHSD